MLIVSNSNLSADPPIYDPEDQMEDLQALTFDDLLSFALQVAKGMEFLSSKNVRATLCKLSESHPIETLLFK